MRTTRIAAALAALLLVAVPLGFLGAADPPARSAAPSFPNGVAVCDVTYVLDNYSRLKQAMEVFKRDVENAGKQFKAKQEDIARGAEQLKQFKVGTPQYKELEEKLTKDQSDLKVNVSLKEKEYAEKEAKNYLAAYREVENAVKQFSERNGIVLVHRFNGAPIDQNNQNAVRAELFKSTLFYDSRVDITPIILDQLNRSAAVNTAAPKGAPSQPRR